MPLEGMVIHKCKVPYDHKLWPKDKLDQRPLNLAAGHKKCPSCGLEVNEKNFSPISKELHDILKAGAKD